MDMLAVEIGRKHMAVSSSMNLLTTN
jgi:hypothetical protein